MHKAFCGGRWPLHRSGYARFGALQCRRAGALSTVGEKLCSMSVFSGLYFYTGLVKSGAPLWAADAGAKLERRLLGVRAGCHSDRGRLDHQRPAR